MSVSSICVPSLLSTMLAVFSDSLSFSGSRVAARVPALQLVSRQLQWEKLMFSNHFSWGLTGPGGPDVGPVLIPGPVLLVWVSCPPLERVVVAPPEPQIESGGGVCPPKSGW